MGLDRRDNWCHYRDLLSILRTAYGRPHLDLALGCRASAQLDGTRPLWTCRTHRASHQLGALRRGLPPLRRRNFRHRGIGVPPVILSVAEVATLQMEKFEILLNCGQFSDS